MFHVTCRARIFPSIRKLRKKCPVRRTYATHANQNACITYNDEVLHAKNNGLPIVALESTIITHGMPYPENLETALRVENIVRKQGAVPATIGVLDGKIRVGIDRDSLEQLATLGQKGVVKCSRRDFPFVISQKLNGGTTVSGTLLVANLAEIPIMATGGIGGVHRFGERTFDVSADLVEMGRTPVAVVSAGVKAILDIPKTLEFLETQGVPVVTLGDNNIFPAFFSRETVDKIKSPYKVANASAAADLVRAQRELKLAGGILFAVPIPHEHSLDATEIELAIKKALLDADRLGIKGKEVTPYLLQRLNEITAGRSLRANCALIDNNARIAADIAVHLYLNKNSPKISISGNSTSRQNLKNGPVIIGGAIMDTVVQVTEPSLNLDGRTHEGAIRQSFGGVGRNVAAALINLRVKDAQFLSVVGDDPPGRTLRAGLKGGDSMLEVLKDIQTARYVAVIDHAGECKFGVGDMKAHQSLSPDLIRKHRSRLETAGLLVLDGNPPLETIGEVLDIATASNVPVWYEPTDLSKAAQIFRASDSWSKSLHFISPNVNELLAIARYFEIPAPVDPFNIDLKTIEIIAEKLATRVPVVLTTLRPRGLMVTRAADARDKFYDTNGQLVRNPSRQIMTRLYAPLPLAEKDRGKVGSASGCGDCLVAGLIRGIYDDLDEVGCVELALKAASQSLISVDPVPTNLSVSTIL